MNTDKDKKDEKSDDKSKHRGYTENSKLHDADSSLEGRWSNIQADYRKKNPDITDEDIQFRSGEFDHMIASIARRTNKSKEEVENDIRSWHI